MRILFVEDNETFVSQIAPFLRNIGGIDDVKHVRSRDAAIAAIEDASYDLVILDLTIPAVDDSLDIAADHGQTVFHEIRLRAPGTPTFILTGSEPDEFSRRLARFGENLDLWGTGSQTNTVDYFLKEEVDKLLERVSQIADVVAGTDSITIDSRGRDVGLSEVQRRIVKVFGRKAGGVSCEVKSLGGGLSDAKVVQAIAKDDQGRVMANCAAKLGTKEEIETEITAYEQHVKRLGVGCYPPAVCTRNKGVGGGTGQFYTLADEHTETFFKVSHDDAAEAAGVLAQVKEKLTLWTGARAVSETTVGDIRRRCVSDQSLASILRGTDLPFIGKIEEGRLRAAQSCVHGDLHGGNILVDRGRRPILIDFGDVGPGYTALDPVTLELSLLFHPEGVRLGLSDSLAPIIASWPDVDRYIAGHALAPLLRACRDWAHDVAGGDLDVLANGYGFALRQLKYETVPKEVTLRLLESISDKIAAG